ncbi:DUF6146 family protein [uncultured Flavobacterium sp.]|uniref:DUF6146 family protein n=1 Tax=uncultured Flavobacterium sp. TaxID=165435 RepID=UPI0025E4F2A1|nr:DUF6146 family protein [uncultured Flavobacterium sp.]
MKTYAIILLAMMGTVIGCGTKNDALYSANANANATEAATAGTVNDTVRIANDSLEYEVIIIDPGFNAWLASRARPRDYYGQEYLETKNRLWVMEWNSRVLQVQRYGNLYQMRIEYESNIDYGYEVNYLLYNYLVYFQITNNQKLGGIVPFP